MSHYYENNTLLYPDIIVQFIDNIIQCDAIMQTVYDEKKKILLFPNP